MEWLKNRLVRMHPAGLTCAGVVLAAIGLCLAPSVQWQLP